MGIVYKDHDPKLEHFVAIKIHKESTPNILQPISRLKNEAKSQAKLSHQNIVSVY